MLYSDCPLKNLMHAASTRIQKFFSSLHKKKYASHAIFAAFAIVFVVANIFSYNTTAFAATYNFVQSSWAGGLDGGTTATSAANQSNWTKYATSTGLTMGTTVQIPQAAYTFTDDGATSTSPSIAAYGGGFANGTSASTASFTDDGATSTTATTATYGGGFANGTNSSTVVSGTGTAAGVGLSSNMSGLIVASSSATYTAVGGGVAATVKSDGTVWTWGNTLVPSQVPGLAGVTAVSVGGYGDVYALKSDGTVWAWGNNNYGQLGNNTTTSSSVPVQVSGLTGVVTIGSGVQPSAYAVKSDGTVWAWGINSSGQLGNNTTTNSSVPVQVSGLTGVTAITAGQYAAYALKSDGTVWAWGHGSWGELGNGLATASLVPVQVSITGVTAIGTIGKSLFAIKSDGTLWAWGPNSSGEFGNNTTTQSNTPIQVLTGVRSVATEDNGYDATLVAKTDGTVWASGYNNYGQLGNNSTTQSLVWVQVSGLTNAVTVFGNSLSGYAIKSDGTMWAWGYNSGGELGNNTTTSSLVPVQVLSGIASYPTSGTFTSAVIDTGATNTLSSLSYNATTPANTAITVDVRAGNTATPDGTWTGWQTGVLSGGDISALGSQRYVQYRANLSTTDTTVTPTLNSLTVNWTSAVANDITGSGTGASVGLPTTSRTYVLTALATPTIVTGANPSYGVAVSPDGTSVYIANDAVSSGEISMYSRNTTTGALTALATPTIAAGSYPQFIAISPDGTSVYTANNNDGTISMYSRNTTTGALTALATPTIAEGSAPYGIAISPDGTSVYATNYNSNTVSMYSRNTTTGALTALATPTIAAGASPIDIAISSDGTSVYATNANDNTISMYSRNTTTGALTALATPTIAAGGVPRGITISPDGTSVYAVNYTGGSTVSMYSRNTTTGALTALATPTIAAGASPIDIAISSDGTSVYATNYASSTVSMYSRNTTTGALTALATPTIAAGASPVGIAISSDGTSVYVGNNGGGTISMYSRSVTLTYAPSASFTSAPINLGSPSTLNTLSYADTLNGESLTMDVRAGNTPTPDGTWTAWTTNVASGASIASLGAKQYVQYRANLSTTNSAVTPTLDSVTIGYSKYGSGSFLSSVYDSGDPHNLVTNMMWNATGTSTTETVKFQIRSASTTALLATAPWCGPADTSAPCTGTSYCHRQHGRHRSPHD